MSLASRTTVARIAGLGVALAVLGGCVTSAQNTASERPENLYQVKSVTLRHDVLFAGRSTRMDRAARGGLEQFLLGANLRHGDEVIVSAATVGASAKEGRRAQRRRTQVARYLQRRRVSISYANHSAKRLGGKSVTVRINRAVAIAPNCPDWDTAVSGGALDGMPSRMGCMNASALANMVANPSDLVRTRKMAPGDGEYMTRGTRAYRAGKAKQPKSSDTN